MPEFEAWSSEELHEEYEELGRERSKCSGGSGCECESLREERNEIQEILEDRGDW